MKSFWEKYQDACFSKGLSPNAAAKEIGVSSGSVTAWKNGATPNTTTLNKIAEYFDVKPTYFLGIEEKKKELLSLLDDDPIDQQISEIIRLYRLCDARGQLRISQVALNEWERTKASEKEAM